jgi:MFS family permease
MRGGGMAALWLAQLAGCLTFVPLFALLLPRRIIAIAGADAPRVLAVVLCVGAACASLANLAAGRIGDGLYARNGNRRILIAAGMGCTALTLAAIGLVGGTAGLIGWIILLQAALNLLLAPLTAVLADHVPNHSRGTVAAWLGLALPLAGLGTTALARLFPTDTDAAFITLGGLVFAGCLPLVLVWPFGRAHAPERAETPASPAAPAPSGLGTALVVLWLARLLVQAGAAFVLNYYFLALSQWYTVRDASALVGSLALVATASVVLVVPIVGQWSDRRANRVPLLILSALGLTVAVLLLGRGWPLAALAGIWSLFHCSLATYLAIDAALVASWLDQQPTRGRVLGYMNLANTLPTLIVPGVVLLAHASRIEASWSVAFGIAAIAPLMAAGVMAARGQLPPDPLRAGGVKPGA